MTIMETNTLLFNIIFLYRKKWEKTRNQLSRNKVFFKKTRICGELDVWSDKNFKYTMIMFMLRGLLRKMNNIHEQIGNFNRVMEMIKTSQ